MKPRSPSPRGKRRPARRRTTAAIALLWLALNTLPTALALGDWAVAGATPASAADEDVWLEPRHLQHDEEDCSRSRDCVFSSSASQGLVGPPTEHVIFRLDPRDAARHAHAAVGPPPCVPRIAQHQPRAPPRSP